MKLLWLVVVAMCIAPGDSLSKTQDRRGLDAKALPAGWKLDPEQELSPDYIQVIQKKLNARIERITHQAIWAGGVSAQINVLSCSDEKKALVAYQALLDARGDDFVSCRGFEVIEVANCSAILAKKIRHCLDLGPRAERVYEVNLRIACIDRLDYMQGNRVSNIFWAKDSEDHIRELTKDWVFGTTLRLWTGSRPWFRAEYSFDPPPSAQEEADGVTTFTFRAPPRRFGIPYVDVKAVVHVKDAYRAGGEKSSKDLCTSTARWPVEDVRELAGRLTSGAKTPQEKVEAILAYVFADIRNEGEITGSRYGTGQVLQQKFGHCWDKSDVFVTLCRSAHLPARQIAGWLPVLNAGHVWAEVYLDGQGWVPVDPTASWTGTSDDYVPWFSTSDGEMPIVYLAFPSIRQRK